MQSKVATDLHQRAEYVRGLPPRNRKILEGNAHKILKQHRVLFPLHSCMHGNHYQLFHYQLFQLFPSKAAMLDGVDANHCMLVLWSQRLIPLLVFLALNALF